MSNAPKKRKKRAPVNKPAKKTIRKARPKPSSKKPSDPPKLKGKNPKYLAELIEILKNRYPDAETALHHTNTLQLLVATILSAQCTDVRVNKVTPILFERYRTAKDFSYADPEELIEIIRSTGYYNNKAKNIIAMAKVLLKEHGGEVPHSMGKLVTLPGVARKTANVVLGSAFGKAEGIVVDTHVLRLSGRLGLSDNKNPVKVERDLMNLFEEKYWIWIAHALINHGRKICKARKPACGECPLNKICPSAFSFD